MPVTSRVRVAVLGCADIALRRMLPAMAASADVELIAVASRDAHKANETARRFGCAAVHGYDALLARDDVDAVYVPLPAALHDVWVEAALRAGKHVLAEKPLTTSQVRTAELLRLASARGLALVENVLFVHHGQHAAVRALVRDGAIGQTRSLQASFAVPARPEHDIRYRAALGGGALWDVGVYPVRAALYLLGSPLTVAGAVLMSDPGREVDTSGAALLRSEAGAVAHLTFGIGHAYHSGYELRGSEGRITVDRAFTPPPTTGPYCVWSAAPAPRRSPSRPRTRWPRRSAPSRVRCARAAHRPTIRCWTRPRCSTRSVGQPPAPAPAGPGPATDGSAGLTPSVPPPGPMASRWTRSSPAGRALDFVHVGRVRLLRLRHGPGSSHRPHARLPQRHHCPTCRRGRRGRRVSTAKSW